MKNYDVVNCTSFKEKWARHAHICFLELLHFFAAISTTCSLKQFEGAQGHMLLGVAYMFILCDNIWHKFVWHLKMKDCFCVCKSLTFSNILIESVNDFSLVYKATDITRVNANAHKLLSHTHTHNHIHIFVYLLLALTVLLCQLN